jgi:predicted amino acid racemase
VFLDVLVRRNPSLIEVATELHQRGQLPPNSYVIDLDAVRSNARAFAQAAARHDLLVLAMTKQMGRNPQFLRAISEGGISSFVAVDMVDARRIHTAGHRVGHIGHLVQVPRREAAAAARMTPDYWTVFNREKAREASEAAGETGRTQDLLARVFDEGDVFYRGHEGGFPAEEIGTVAEDLDSLPSARFSGVTTFPALLFDERSQQVEPTPNLRTLERVAQKLLGLGRSDIEINAPGTTSSEVLPILASAGATQVEPGHGLTGTTPLHAVRDLPELPAVVYLSEISHLHGGRAYCFGGGLYIDPVFPPYQVQALVSRDPAVILSRKVPAELPPPGSIDYYGMLDAPKGLTVTAGDTAIFGFRIQAFVTRAFVAPVSGIQSGAPSVKGIWSAAGQEERWPS